MQVNMLEAKSNLSKLVKAIETGHEKSIVIARNGLPVAQIIALHPKRKRKLGIADGKLSISDEDWTMMDKDLVDMFEEDTL